MPTDRRRYCNLTVDADLGIPPEPWGNRFQIRIHFSFFLAHWDSGTNNQRAFVRVQQQRQQEQQEQQQPKIRRTKNRRIKGQIRREADKSRVASHGSDRDR